MVFGPRPGSIQHYVLSVFQENPNEALERGFIVKRAGELADGAQFSPGQIDGAINSLINRGIRISRYHPGGYGRKDLTTYTFATKETGENWVVEIACDSEIEAHRVATELRKVSDKKIKVKKV